MMDRQILNDVLFLLRAAEDKGFGDLNRTSIQKLLYLTAALFPLTGHQWGYGFSNGRYGPFNQKINQAGDRLAIYGFAELKTFGIQAEGYIRATYKITLLGRAEVRRIIRLRNEKRRFEWIGILISVLDIYGPQVISKLAHREPSFREMQRNNQQGLIDLSLQQNQSLALVTNLGTRLKNDFNLETETLVSKLILFFDFLSSDVSKAA